MSVLSPKRVILFVAATLLALPLFATNPSPRYAPRMAFDEQSGIGVLFGGRAVDDPATGLVHASDETWTWVRNQWVQQLPAVRPPARSEHAMVYDSKRDRIILFGGRKEATVVRQKFSVLGDTWAWQNGEWQDLAPGTAPPARYFPGLAYDADRDRVVLFGGYDFTEDGKAIEARFDTWEYDGDNWTRVNESGPEVSKPLLVFDAARHETLMLGLDGAFATLMYRWDSATSTWKSVAPAQLPPCVNEAQLIYRTAGHERPLVAGGICTNTTSADEVYEWDGTTWTKLTLRSTARIVNAAMAYDSARSQVVRFGGYPTFQTTPDSFTYLLRGQRWYGGGIVAEPGPRSMPLFRADPERRTVWLFGGLSEYSFGGVTSYLDDFWQYQDGVWRLMPDDPTNTPNGCVTPIGAFDADRKVLVVLCNGSAVTEWDGTAWKRFTNLSQVPPDRRFAGAVYDQTQKKVVLFGGYDNFGNYRQDTWTWNGTAWTEIKPSTKPPHRAQPVMWYDPLAKKTIIYSGAGRKSIEDHATRYSDMWSFDGSNWTQLSVTATPGIRFAPQIAVDPNSGKLFLFGGLRATLDDKNRVTQFYDDDMWIWDGSTSTWTELHPENPPSPRQNAAFDYDPVLGRFVLYGGFAGNFYLSDRWVWDGQNWTPAPDFAVFRRRSTRP